MAQGLASGLDFRFNAHKSLNIYCMTAIRAFGSVTSETWDHLRNSIASHISQNSDLFSPRDSGNR
jgi:hypothetical protein